MAADELAHVKFLRSALGHAAVDQPEIDIGYAFAHAANAAFNTTLVLDFIPYDSDALFLLGSFIFEDVGVTAYKVCEVGFGIKRDDRLPACLLMAACVFLTGGVPGFLYEDRLLTLNRRL